MNPCRVRRLCAVIFSSFLLGAVSVTVLAAGHAAPDSGGDPRQWVTFPAPMVQHHLAHMREHLQALGEIQAALAARDYPRAAELADTRLGLNSPMAAVCKPAMSPAAAGMPAMMAQLMPEGMRTIGFQMHSAASELARVASGLHPGDDPLPAVAALADVTRQCVACHAAYRTR